MRTEELDYELPPERIATAPARPRDSARLMMVDRHSGRIEHHHVRDLAHLFEPGDLIVVNRTRVVPALFEARRLSTGAKVRGLWLSAPDCDHWIAVLKSRGTLTTGEAISLDDRSQLTLVEPHGAGRWLTRLTAAEDSGVLLGRLGQTPLPPYIRKARQRKHQRQIRPEDVQSYNTVYATDPGSVAAPTAGLHFTAALLADLARHGVARAEVTLHIGLGTFAPVRSGTLADHHMHEEWAHVPQITLEVIRRARRAGKRVVPIGTSTVRALESLPQAWDAPAERPPGSVGGYTGYSTLFIRPGSGFAFRFTDALLTNFHMPRSTLLALVAALPGIGIERLKGWYRLALAEGYRFYSYGDAMLII